MYVTSTFALLFLVLYLLSFFYDIFDLIWHLWFQPIDDVNGEFPQYSDGDDGDEDSDDDDSVSEDDDVEAIIGLDNSVISTLPKYEIIKIVIDGKGDDAGDGRSTVAPMGSLGSDECVVCLMGVEEGEMVRVLPNCKHLFHVDCIDRWLGSNPTCPMCRKTVEPPCPTTTVDEVVVIMEEIVKHEGAD